MDKAEAEKLYDSGKQPTVEKLLEYDDEVRSLKTKIAGLEKNSKNSSKPPSSDGPQDSKPKPDIEDRPDSKRNPGGQPGHRGSRRELIRVEEVDDIVPHYAHQCDDCGKVLPQDETANVVGDPFRWQISEIEPIRPTVTEHQALTTLCECGCKTTAILPKEITKSNFGPRLTAIIAYLAAVLHVSRRGTCEFCATLLNIDIALGSVQNLLEDTSKALEPVDQEFKDALPAEPVINSDETGWRNR